MSRLSEPGARATGEGRGPGSQYQSTGAFGSPPGPSIGPRSIDGASGAAAGANGRRESTRKPPLAERPSPSGQGYAASAGRAFARWGKEWGLARPQLARTEELKTVYALSPGALRPHLSKSPRCRVLLSMGHLTHLLSRQAKLGERTDERT